ncbi:uncharacterized protein BX663DRAFT_509112 [Cokeromyces recurvatus]|uniref:uncharacterized protein n=1 Tax=Cokeromyces recurvatus TaxID=90255 RepID=UPI00221F36A5|nr:uncharacterized protein BX663DRAFT_509112 [Cokeromyces recurvatus]KAI7902987.1 hypothetical protein BX663DRAFT_509112 [Cokeromyces recurvatus]
MLGYLKQSLSNVLKNAKEYVADVCFEFPDNDTLWAHKAILLVRLPEDFRNQYIPQLNNRHDNDDDDPITYINISHIISYALFSKLLHFWYLAEFSSLKEDEQEIRSLEERLGMKVISEEKDQWITDLKRMMDESICSDVVISIFHATPNTTHHPQLSKEKPPSFSVHRFMLASQSPYFYTVLFTKEFRKVSLSSVHLPSDVFSSITLKIILYYFYTEQLILPSLSTFTLSPPQSHLSTKRYDLRLLDQVFIAADYLGHPTDTICKAVLTRMNTICHQFKCVCPECARLLPFMLYFTDKHLQRHKDIAKLRIKLMTLYSDPLERFVPLWSQRPFAILVNATKQEQSHFYHHRQHMTEDGTQVISQIFINHHETVPTKREDFITQITQQISSNITKQNSIRVLHSLHLCLSALRSADPLPTWSHSLLSIVMDKLLIPTIELVANDFEYYCVEYPVLLSCVDGIVEFSVDFLEFVLKWILSKGINDRNADKLYQGIVRDLGRRQEVVKNVVIDRVLEDAKQKSIEYLSNHWIDIKALGGFSTIDKDILKSIAEDIHVPVRMLTKISTDSSDHFSSMFHFMPTTKKVSTNLLISPSSSIKTSKHKASLNNNHHSPERRARSLSAADATSSSILIRHQSKSDRSVKTGYYSDTEEDYNNHNKNRIKETCLIDALLPLDKVFNTNTNENENENDNPTNTRRSIRFALPELPARMNNIQYQHQHQHQHQQQQQQQRKKKTNSTNKRWSLVRGYYSSDDDTEVSIIPQIGQKVELLRRPLPTLGTIKYIGNVEFARGTWVGVELEARLGNNDGSVEGKRYFETFPQRGVFVKIDDFKIISDKKNNNNL